MCTTRGSGLVNIGTEEQQGRWSCSREAYQPAAGRAGQLYRQCGGRGTSRCGACDVVVCDGFTGNVILKLTEGMAKLVRRRAQGYVPGSSTKTKIAAPAAQGRGAGVSRTRWTTANTAARRCWASAKPVIKAHGSSNAKAFKNAIRQAQGLHAQNGVIDKIERLEGGAASRKRRPAGSGAQG